VTAWAAGVSPDVSSTEAERFLLLLGEEESGLVGGGAVVGSSGATKASRAGSYIDPRRLEDIVSFEDVKMLLRRRSSLVVVFEIASMYMSRT